MLLSLGFLASLSTAAPAPTAVALAPAIVLPQADWLAAATVPPKPKLAGIGSVIVGWSMVGVGAIVAVYSLPFVLAGAGYGAAAPFRKLGIGIAVVGGGIAIGGVALALSGHSTLSESRAERESWKQQYGKK